MVFNSATLIGNLGSDLELRTTASGSAYTRVSLAQNRTYVNRDGEQVKETSWFKLSGYGKTAERMAERLGKGSRVLAEGRLRSYTYDRDGQSIPGVELVVLNFQELPRRASSGAADTAELAGELVDVDAGVVEAAVPF